MLEFRAGGANMNLAVLRDARDEAERGLHELLAEIDLLRRREKHLVAAIASLELAIGDDSATGSSLNTLPSPVPSNELQQLATESALGERTYWEVAKDLLEEQNEPMTVPQMLNVLASRGQKVQGDGLRVAMIRRSDIFSKTGYGKYGLASWPKHEVEKDASEVDMLSPEEAFGSPSAPYDVTYRSYVLAQDHPA
jgi:hypothetical protein